MLRYSSYWQVSGDGTVGCIVRKKLFLDLSRNSHPNQGFGRRPIFFTSLIIQSISGIGAALMPNALTFLIARFIIGLTASALYIASFILGWILPESSRWLLSKGRQAEAKQILKKVAKTNNVLIPEKVLDNLGAVTTNDDEGKGKHSALDLVRYPNLRNRSLNIFFNWFVISCTYFGLSWNSSSLGGNDYLNFLISGLVEIPAPGLLILTLDRWGRKPLFTGTMLLTASVLLLSNLIPQDLNWLRITLIMVGKLSVTASFNVVYIMSAEQFPTVLRNVGIGSSSTCARIGGIVAPYVIFSATAWKAFPEVIFGLLTLSGGFLGLLLPETLNNKLPDTVQEGENYGKVLDTAASSPAIVDLLAAINLVNRLKERVQEIRTNTTFEV
uniref:Organic cation transporter n=2 Tax=Timema TaxID=61471 RepID=A0A7R9EBJ4_9NEOP|nr:unnamed protein product [Timema monikensis]